MKILIAGGHGQLGRDCARVLSASHQVHAAGHGELDITDPGSIERVCRAVDPRVIINCAAFTRVDECESSREKPWQINAVGPSLLGQYAAAAAIRLVHISTDYVFDGSREVPLPYREDDATNPLSWYGRGKLAGEEGVLQSGCSHLIVRAAWLYGIHGANFLKAVLRKAVRQPEARFRVVNDQFGSPTWSYRLAQQLEVLLEQECEGLYHATAQGYCSWYELAGYFLDCMGLPGRVEPCPAAEYGAAAVRPVNAILENSRLMREKRNRMRHWQSDIDQFVLLFGNQLIREAED